MRRSLYYKLFLSYISFLILCFLTITTFTTHFTYRYLKKQEAENLYREAKNIASTYATNFYQNTLTLSDVEGHLKNMDIYLDAPIWIVDYTGNLLLNTRAEKDSTFTQIENFDIKEFGTKYHKIWDFHDMLPSESLTVYAPIIIDYKVHGYVLIHKPVSDIIKYGDGLVNVFYLSLPIIYLCTIIPLGVFIGLVYHPLRKISKATAEYKNGNFDTEIQIDINDEMGHLATTLNYMASELNSLEEDQRDFIANVSHDFRSPLTSIKGYVDAIMDGTIPPELQDKYLNIILLETERLNKLTQSMLELNKIGAHGAKLDVSEFDINNIIKLTVQSFEGTCIQKRISFELLLTREKLFVVADTSKIQQVIYNLIDNAIKFSHPDSSITIETTERNDKVFVAVKDNGMGIPRDSLKKIWERFYKTDTSRGKDKTGTGLGLAIVKEIIQAHSENINVISTEGVGTEFIFTLPLAKK